MYFYQNLVESMFINQSFYDEVLRKKHILVDLHRFGSDSFIGLDPDPGP